MKKNQNSIKSLKSENKTLAALDLGSNSFHLIIARKEKNTFKIKHKKKKILKIYYKKKKKY